VPKVCIKISERYGGGRRADVDPDNTYTAFIQMQKCGLRPQCVAVRTFGYPSLLDQLFRDYELCFAEARSGVPNRLER